MESTGIFIWICAEEVVYVIISNTTMAVCARCWSRTLYAAVRTSPSGQFQGSRQWQWLSRRGMASMSPEGQHKVYFVGELLYRDSSDNVSVIGCNSGRRGSCCL